MYARLWPSNKLDVTKTIVSCVWYTVTKIPKLFIISTGLCPLQRRLENMAINTKQINIIQNTEKGIIGNNSIIHTYMMWVDMP